MALYDTQNRCLQSSQKLSRIFMEVNCKDGENWGSSTLDSDNLIVFLSQYGNSMEFQVYGSFAFVLGFTLVFRCQQAYQRYFASAKSLHTMSSASWQKHAESTFLHSFFFHSFFLRKILAVKLMCEFHVDQ